MKAIVLLGSLLLICCNNPCYYNSYADVTNYKIFLNRTTASGIRVDDLEEEISLEEIDQRTRELEACLQITIDRRCITVLIPHDWYISECSGEQLFPCFVKDSLCEEKMRAEGMSNEQIEIILAKCPCACRATIQNEEIIVTAPNLKLYKAELARMVTGVNDPWATERTRRCL